MTYGTPGSGLGVEVAEPGAEALAAQHLGEPLGRPVTLGHQHDPPALGEPAPASAIIRAVSPR